jgi:hypothetical protein
MADAAKQREAAAAELSPGDHVQWNVPVRGGRTRGEVVVKSAGRRNIHTHPGGGDCCCALARTLALLGCHAV